MENSFLEAPRELLPIRPLNTTLKKEIDKEEKIAKKRRELTPRQRIFVGEYLAGSSAYKSARTAGYPESVAQVASGTVLKNPLIQREIRNKLKPKFAELEISVDRILEETAMMAYANILDYVVVDQETGEYKVDLRKIERVKGRAILELSYDPEGRPKLKLQDKRAALELLARYLKMFNQAETPEGKENQTLTIKSLDALVQQITVNQTVNNYPQSVPRLESGQTIDAIQ